MIDPHQLGLFLVAAVLLSIAPGPGMLYVLARTLHGGRREAVASILGTTVGGLAHVVAATLGLSAILLSSALAYSVLKYAGAAYLVYLGFRMIADSRQPLELRAAASGGSHATFRQGVLTEALNPKTAIFFFTFLPQFVSPGGNATLQFLLLGCISVVLNSTADVVVALLAAPLARSFERHPRWRRAQQAGCGVGLVGLGAYVAVGGER